MPGPVIDELDMEKKLENQEPIVEDVKEEDDHDDADSDDYDDDDMEEDGTPGDSIEQLELMGAQAMASVNFYFQAMIHRVRYWKNQAEALEISLEKLKTHNTEMEEKLKGKEEELAIAHAELVSLRASREERS